MNPEKYGKSRWQLKKTANKSRQEQASTHRFRPQTAARDPSAAQQATNTMALEFVSLNGIDTYPLITKRSLEGLSSKIRQRKLRG
jgi:hypothetical protein